MLFFSILNIGLTVFCGTERKQVLGHQTGSVQSIPLQLVEDWERIKGKQLS